MKLTIACAAALTTMTLAAPALAQSAAAAPDAPPPAAAPPAPGASTLASKFGVNTPIEQLAADPAAKAVLEADFPGITAHPMYDSFKSMTLTQLQPMSNGQMTAEQLAKADADFAAIK